MSDDGALEMAFGRFGEGPWEFQRIHGIAETESGQVVVASFRNAWLTYLTSDMIPDTLVPLPELAVQGVHRFQQDLIVQGISNDAVVTPGAIEGIDQKPSHAGGHPVASRGDYLEGPMTTGGPKRSAGFQLLHLLGQSGPPVAQDGSCHEMVDQIPLAGQRGEQSLDLFPLGEFGSGGDLQ